MEDSIIYNGWSLGTTAIVLLAAAALLAVLWLVQVGRAARWLKVLTVSLRLLVVALILAALMEPVLSSRELIPQQSFLVHLFDTSASMGLNDYNGRARIDVLEELANEDAPVREQIDGDYLSVAFSFDEETNIVDSPDDLVAGDNATDIGSALRAVRVQLSGLPISGVVLYSDGNSTIGGAVDSVLATASELPVPVYTVGTAPAVPAPDVWIEKVIHSSEVASNIETPVTALVGVRGMKDKTVQITLTQDGQEVKSRRVKSTQNQQVLSVEFAVRPKGTGVSLYNVAAQVTTPEAYPWNNEEDFFMNVTKKQRRVLYVEGSPRYEYRFLRAAFQDDERFQVASILYVNRQGDMYRQGIKDGSELRMGFPQTEEELFAYDVVVIGDVPASQFSNSQLANLREFVRRRGGGLLFLAGEESFARQGFGSSPLADILPFDLERSRRMDYEARVVPTELGVNRDLFGEYDSNGRKPAPWEDLPVLPALYRLNGLKPGAQSLCTIVEGRGALNAPVVAFQRFGSGTCLVCGISATWPWKFHTPSDDTRYQSFWKGMILVLMEQQQGLFQVDIDPGVSNPGNEVRLSGAVLDAAFELDYDASVDLVVVAPDGTALDLATRRSDVEGNTFEQTFVPDQPGVYRLEATSLGDGVTHEREAVFLVKEESPELAAVDLNAPLLQKIADLTGGAYVHLSEYDTLGDRIKPVQGALYRESRNSLWDAPVLLGAILLVLLSEWFIRRIGGLA